MSNRLIKNFGEVIKQIGIDPNSALKAANIEVKLDRIEDDLSTVHLKGIDFKSFEALVKKINSDNSVNYILVRITEDFLTLWINGTEIHLFSRTT